MHPLFFLCMAFAWLVHADFYIYEFNSAWYGGIKFHSLPEPGCLNLNYADWWLFEADASGDRLGCRIVRGPTPEESPDVLEYNTNFGHFTIYKARNWGIFDLEDKQHGICQPYSDYTFDCDKASLENYWGKSFFNCSTDIGTS